MLVVHITPQIKRSSSSPVHLKGAAFPGRIYEVVVVLGFRFWVVSILGTRPRRVLP